MSGRSIHGRLNESKSFSLIESAVDDILEPLAAGGPLRGEVIEPLLLVARQIELLRTGSRGPLSVEQREALNLAHGRLSQVVAMLREMEGATSLAAQRLAGERITV